MVASWQGASTSAPSIEFAPFGALRAAAWPLQALDSFGSPELLEAAAKARTGLASRAIESLYRQTLTAERAALWSQTAGDERFMKALALANPTLLQRVRERSAHPLTETPDKRTRHLETTLYRLLARAVGRTEPFGAWSGVGIVKLGQQTRLQRISPQRVAAPDLGFYAAVLRSLGSRRGTARLARYRINPTLGPRVEGGWGFWAPPRGNVEGYCSLEADPVLDEALQRLASLDSFTIEQAERALAVRAGVLDDFFFEQLLPQGVLVGGLALPPFFADPWEALQRIEVEQPVPRLSAWVQLREALRALCRRVEDEFEGASCAALLQLSAEAKRLARRFGAELQLEGVPELRLYLDSGVPWRLTLGPDFVAALSAGVARDQADLSGPVRPFNESLRRAQCERIGSTGLPIRGLPESGLVDLSCSHEWPRVPPAEYFPDWPLRTVIADITAPGDVPARAAQLQLGALNLVDDVASPLARFLPLLRRQDAEGAQALVAWLRQAHAGVQPRLAAFSEGEVSVPNALSQPDLGLPRFSLWSIAEGVSSLAGARITALKERGLLTLSQAGSQYALASLSAVNLLRSDPALQLLLMSSLRLPRPTSAAAQPPVAQPSEPRTPSPSHPRRMQADVLAALGRCQGLDRFITWAAACDQRRGRQIVERPGTSSLLVGIDSPLAVAALLEGVGPGWHFLQFQDAATLPQLQCGAERYVARLVLPFRRTTAPI